MHIYGQHYNSLLPYTNLQEKHGIPVFWQLTPQTSTIRFYFCLQYKGDSSNCSSAAIQEAGSCELIDNWPPSIRFLLHNAKH